MYNSGLLNNSDKGQRINGVAMTLLDRQYSDCYSLIPPRKTSVQYVEQPLDLSRKTQTARSATNNPADVIKRKISNTEDHLITYNIPHTSEYVHETNITLNESRREFCCERCTYSSYSSSDLMKHLRSHTGEKPYACTEPNCYRRFARPDALKRHKRIHTGEKPHVCKVCSGSFARKDHFKRHIRIHQDNP